VGGEATLRTAVGVAGTRSCGSNASFGRSGRLPAATSSGCSPGSLSLRQPGDRQRNFLLTLIEY